MTKTAKAAEPHLKAQILALMNENNAMTVATLRPDGWPQATLVGFVNDDLTLYFAVARSSQKLANIERDPRVSIALGRHADRLRGLSMAAHAAAVTERAEIDHLAALMARRYAHQSRFSPRETPSVLIRAKPTFISIIDLPYGPGEPELTDVAADGVIHRIEDRPGGAVHGETVHVQSRRSSDVYRPGAPL